jgi:hypothetical protein
VAEQYSERDLASLSNLITKMSFKGIVTLEDLQSPQNPYSIVYFRSKRDIGDIGVAVFDNMLVHFNLKSEIRPEYSGLFF